MKLQLDENTLNAYINEAIRQELKEGYGNPFGVRNTPIKASPLAPENQGRWYGQQIDLADRLQRRKAWDAEQERKRAAGIRQNPLPISVDLFQYMYNTHYGGHLKIDGIWGPETEKAYKDYVRRGGSLQDYKIQQYAPGPNGPVRINENTLNAYINEAIKQELNEAIKVDFDALGPANNPKRDTPWLVNNRNYFNLDKQKEALAAGTFGKGGLFGRAPKDAIQVLKDLGYSDEQIRSGITNGAIRMGKNTETNGFTKYDKQKKQNRKTGNLMAAAGMDVLGNTPTGGAQDSIVGPGGGQDAVRTSTGQDTGEAEVNWPWNSITQEEIDAAKRAQRAARQAAVAKKAQQQQQTDAAQTRKNITAVDPNPSKEINTPGVTRTARAVNPVQTQITKPGVTQTKTDKPIPQQNTQTNFVAEVIKAMGQQARSGDMALVNRTAQNAINALQKNGGQQNSNAIAQIKNALASLTKNGQ